jgi:predicted permease
VSFFDAVRYRLRALTRSSARDRSGIASVESVRQDVRFVMRLLRRRIGFAVVTVATIALGIAATTTIYSVADAVLFRPLAFPKADELMTVWLTRPAWKTIPGIEKRWDQGTLSLPSFRRWRSTQRSFVEVGAWESMSAMVGDASSSVEEMMIGRATASLFPTLAINPEIGSWFSDSDDVQAGPPVAIVSHETWVARFGADPHVLGRVVEISGKRHTIVGVAPKGFSLDRGPNVIAYWLPAAQDSASADADGSFAFQVIGRIKSGASIQAASVEAAHIIRNGAVDSQIAGTRLTPLHEEQTRAVRRPLLLLLVASGLLLLIACINVATLLLGEAVGREHELRTRSALGASRGRLVRQLLTESVLLSGMGAIIGASLAAVSTRILVRTAPASIPGLNDVSVDIGALAIALAAAVLTGVLFGLVPALTLVRQGTAGFIAAGRHVARGGERAQRTFIVCEVALSIVLLVAGGLLVHSFSKLSSIGFDPEGMFVANLRFPQPAYPDSDHVRSLIVQIEQRLASLPGIIAVGATTTPPFSSGSSSTSIEIEGRPASRTSPGPVVHRRVTTPSFFAAARIGLVAGRLYTDADRAGAPQVVVISRAMADREWRGQSAVGKRIKFMDSWRTVVGVVDDVATERPTAEPPAIVYAPLAQLMLRSAPWITIRTRENTSDLLAELRGIVTTVEPDVSVSRVASVRSLVDDALADDRLRTVLISLFAAIAALLAAIGTYGVASTAANRRTREMAIRIAVGASHGSIARLVIGGVSTAVAIGAVVGAGLSLVGSRLLTPFLYGVSIGDPRVFAGVAIFLALSTVAATWMPARRAMRVRLVETLSAD